MNDDSGPRSPFAMSPSARPPSADEARVVVRVPAPNGTPAPYTGTPMYGAYGNVAPQQAPQAYPSQYPPPYPSQYPPPYASQHPPPADAHFVNAQTMLSGSGAALGALPPEEEKKKVSPVPIVAVLLAAAVLGGVMLFGKSPEQAPAPPAEPTPVPESAAVAPQAPPTPAAPPVPAVPQVIASPEPPPPAPAAFDAVAAARAIDAVVPTAASCKLPKGKVCKVKVAFDPKNGHVKKAEALAPCHGTPPEKCVLGGVKKASVAPFTGAKPVSITYSFPPKK